MCGNLLCTHLKTKDSLAGNKILLYAFIGLIAWKLAQMSPSLLLATSVLVSLQFEPQRLIGQLYQVMNQITLHNLTL
jgi:hypothetical protein